MRESTIEARLVKGVKELGGRAYKFVSPGNNGVPDRLVILPGGRIIFVELKTEEGTVTPKQTNQHMTLRGLGAEVRVLHGMGEVKGFLRELKGGGIE